MTRGARVVVAVVLAIAVYKGWRVWNSPSSLPGIALWLLLIYTAAALWIVWRVDRFVSSVRHGSFKQR